MFAASLGLQSINKDKGWRKDPFIYRRVTIDPPGITGLLGAEQIKAPIKLELERSRQRSFVYCYWRQISCKASPEKQTLRLLYISTTYYPDPVDLFHIPQLLYISPKITSTNRPLVDFGLSKVLDNVGAVKETAVASLGTAKGASTLNDVVIALEVGLRNTA